MGMSQDQRSPGADVIEILVPVDIKEMGPGPARDEQRLATDRAEGPCRTVHAAGENPTGMFKRFPTANTSRFHAEFLGRPSSTLGLTFRSELFATLLCLCRELS